MPDQNLSQRFERYADDARHLAQGDIKEISSQTKKDVVEAIGNSVVDHQVNQALGLKNSVSVPIDENTTLKVGITNENQPFIGVNFKTEL